MPRTGRRSHIDDSDHSLVLPELLTTVPEVVSAGSMSILTALHAFNYGSMNRFLELLGRVRGGGLLDDRLPLDLDVMR